MASALTNLAMTPFLSLRVSTASKAIPREHLIMASRESGEAISWHRQAHGIATEPLALALTEGKSGATGSSAPCANRFFRQGRGTASPPPCVGFKASLFFPDI